MNCKIYKLKKANFVIFASLFVLLFCKVSYANEVEMFNNKPVVRGIVEWDMDITNLEELEENSELIIRGVIQNEKESLVGSDYTGYIHTNVLVTEVLKGDENLVNNTISFSEQYFETEIDGVSKYVMYDNYSPAITGREYILFLKSYKGDYEAYNGVYLLVYGEKGKYIVNENSDKTRAVSDDAAEELTNEELNIGPYGSEVYRSIYNEVMEKYTGDTSDNKNNLRTKNNEENESNNEITRTIDEINGINKNGVLLVPLRDAAELTGCDVIWDSISKSIVINKDEDTIIFKINNREYSVNSNIYTLDTAPKIYEGKTYVPLRALSEAMGIEIDYNENDNTVTLN